MTSSPGFTPPPIALALLEALRIRRVILTGIAGNICVLFTANDAHMRELKILAPADCIVSNTAADNDHALRQINVVLKGQIAESTRLTFLPARGAARVLKARLGHHSKA